MLERNFQSDLIKDIQAMIPGCIVIKNDPNYLQGFPDLTIHYGLISAHLEVKRSANASHRPNQDYYVDLINSQGGFARFIFPENKEEVLYELQSALRP